MRINLLKDEKRRKITQHITIDSIMILQIILVTIALYLRFIFFKLPLVGNLLISYIAFAFNFAICYAMMYQIRPGFLQILKNIKKINKRIIIGNTGIILLFAPIEPMIDEAIKNISIFSLLASSEDFSYFFGTDGKNMGMDSLSKVIIYIILKLFGLLFIAYINFYFATDIENKKSFHDDLETNIQLVFRLMGKTVISIIKFIASFMISLGIIATVTAVIVEGLMKPFMEAGVENYLSEFIESSNNFNLGTISGFLSSIKLIVLILYYVFYAKLIVDFYRNFMSYIDPEGELVMETPIEGQPVNQEYGDPKEVEAHLTISKEDR